MSFASVQKALELEFRNKWDVNVQIAWDNQNFKPRKNALPDELATTWVRFTVVQGDGALQGLGADTKMYRYAGVIVVSVFVVEGTGAQTAKTLCDDVATIFRSKQIASDNIFCQTPGIVPIGADSGWWQTNVTIPFYWDDFTNP